MIFAIPFTRNFKYLNDNVEFNINYKPEIKKLDTFLQEYQNHRVNLHFSEYISVRDMPILQALTKKYSNLVAVFQEYTKELEQELNENGIPHYYEEYICSFDRFNGFLTLNITDIFVANELCFALGDLARSAKEKRIRLRTYCNVAQSEWDDTPSIQTFFIRPEDIPLYENVLDVVEFFLPTKEERSKINVLYQIYAKDQRWAGPLKEIILNFKDDCDNKHIVSLFGIKRLNCHKKCAYKTKNTYHLCRTCNIFSDLADSLKENHLVVTVEK